MVSPHLRDGHPTSQNLVHKHNSQNKDQAKCHGWSATFPRMVTIHFKDGHHPFQGWSPTIQNLPEGSVLKTLNLPHKLNSQN